ncbi:MAG: TonB-dependent receptor [Acidobacteria bacterium]|nr:TonB-dependent receptor [Acidobacteriota bacterium]
MKVVVKFFPLSVFTLVLVFCTALGQPKIQLTGSVSEATNAVIPNAAIRVLNAASNKEVIALTDQGGNYSINDLSPGSYRVTATAQGFASVSVILNLRVTTTQNFSLFPGSIEDTVTITANKGNVRAAEDTAQTVSVASEQSIDQRRPASTYQAIERTPNLIQAGANPSIERPRLRGLAASRVLIVIDGERFNNVRTDAGSTGLSPSVVDVTQLNAVEVVSSAGSSLYGSDALAGTINLITKTPLQTTDDAILALRFDGDVRTNERLRRTGLAINWSIPKFAARLSGSLFRVGNYRSGNQTITLDQVVSVGQFATNLANTLVGPATNLGPLANVARTYAVWNLPAGGEVLNSQGHGGNAQVDAWFFPSSNHSLRYRQLNSQHYNIGLAFSAPPFDPFISGLSFRRLDKYGARYEGRELTGILARVAGGFYWQKFSSPQDQIATNIPNASTVGGNSSWTLQRIPNPSVPNSFIDLSVLTGKPSVFQFANTTSNQNKNTITSIGADVQATMIPFSNALVTTGFGYLEDRSRDEFARFTFDANSQPSNFAAGATTPNASYRNLGWFNLLEYDPVRWLHLTGGFRVDNWATEATPTKGFPLGSEVAILNASLSALKANPGSININGIDGALALISGTGKLSTNNTIVTGNAGVVLRLPFGVNPYFRWGNSYREPEITTRYIVRNFGSPAFSVPLVSNTGLKPERGKNYDAGVKIRRNSWQASFGWFRNDLSDFIRSVTSPVYFIAADPAKGLLPLFPGGPHGVQYGQRINSARARIQGIEATAETSLSLGDFGSITPFLSLGYLKGTDLSPQANALTVIERFYNQGTPIQLKGSATDVPLQNITPFRAVYGATYTDKQGAWFAEYQARSQARVRRIDPLDITAPNTTQYGTFASLAPFTKQTARVGYNWRRDHQRISFTVGVENLTNRLYFEHFQTAPAPGRSVVFGITTDFFNLLRR